MKIQLLQPINGSATPKEEFNSIVRLALNANSLSTFAAAIESKKFYQWEIGFGGTHCWVKQKDINGNLYSDNTLIITND